MDQAKLDSLNRRLRDISQTALLSLDICQTSLRCPPSDVCGVSGRRRRICLDIYKTSDICLHIFKTSARVICLAHNNTKNNTSHLTHVWQVSSRRLSDVVEYGWRVSGRRRWQCLHICQTSVRCPHIGIDIYPSGGPGQA